MSSYRKKRRPPGTERTDKQQSLLTETQYSNPGVQRDLSSNQLTSGLPYQRPVEPEDVDRLIAKWDDRLLTPLVVISTLPILMARRPHCLRRLTACKAASTLGL